ncbi:MAG: hypothetical protein QOE61_849, partial [Micromonosporaceae bacterium]|nr:hypothetical protein [Micromonosporaceae bacterium]
MNGGNTTCVVETFGPAGPVDGAALDGGTDGGPLDDPEIEAVGPNGWLAGGDCARDFGENNPYALVPAVTNP